MDVLNYTQEIKKINACADSPPLAYVDVYGCQQNEADGERLRGMLEAMGYSMSPSRNEADVVVVNTCAVRRHAEESVLGHVGAMPRTIKPGRILAVCGCMAQQKTAQEKIKRSYPQVDLMFGPSLLPKFPELLYGVIVKGGRHFHIADPTVPIEENLPVSRGAPPRAWVTVMTGCDNFCTYCIVPYVRGRERSREPQAILAETTELINHGYTEIFLLGQNVNSYRPSSREIPNFPALLKAVNSLEGDFTIRFMTSHPKDAGTGLIDAMAECSKVTPILHLPFQSGSNRILKLMNRGYTSEQYSALVKYAREAIPEISITSDVIVGFPGETQDDFECTLDLMRQIQFDGLFTFIYSPRDSTPASMMPDTIGEAEKKQRLLKLIELQKAIERGEL